MQCFLQQQHLPSLEKQQPMSHKLPSCAYLHACAVMWKAPGCVLQVCSGITRAEDFPAHLCMPCPATHHVAGCLLQASDCAWVRFWQAVTARYHGELATQRCNQHTSHHQQQRTQAELPADGYLIVAAPQKMVSCKQPAAASAPHHTHQLLACRIAFLPDCECPQGGHCKCQDRTST
jgi:hypothetical protein